LKRSQIAFSELTIEKLIGEGTYGKVCVGKWNGAPVALKFCKKKGSVEDFMKEVKLMLYVSICSFISTELCISFFLISNLI
jgi:predicted Ser/Thr protein kinase